MQLTPPRRLSPCRVVGLTSETSAQEAQKAQKAQEAGARSLRQVSTPPVFLPGDIGQYPDLDFQVVDRSKDGSTTVAKTIRSLVPPAAEATFESFSFRIVPRVQCPDLGSGRQIRVPRDADVPSTRALTVKLER